MRSRSAKLIAGILFISACTTLTCLAQGKNRQFQFEQFSVKVYSGPIHLPKGFYKDKDGAWRDALDKWVEAPEVSFAGEYFLVVHSCGTFCRYYELHDLRTGVSLSDVDQFDVSEDPPKTPDGHPYLTMLYSRPESRLLIAEYHLDFGDPNKVETCRQQYFLFKEGHLKAISKVFPFCTEERQGRQ